MKLSLRTNLPSEQGEGEVEAEDVVVWEETGELVEDEVQNQLGAQARAVEASEECNQVE